MDMLMDRQQVSGHACSQVDRQAGGRQAGGQAGMQGDRQAGRGTDSKACGSEKLCGRQVEILYVQIQNHTDMYCRCFN